MSVIAVRETMEVNSWRQVLQFWFQFIICDVNILYTDENDQMKNTITYVTEQTKTTQNL